jgi:glyoxylase-like metal-dependent hydrolase (beta-lactamase superfamily II)
MLAGPGSTRALTELWLYELACMDCVPEPNGGDWRTVSLAASTKLASKLIALQLAQRVIEKVRTVADKPIKYVGLSHYHAVRVLGASTYGAREIIASEKTRAMIHERRKEDWGSEIARFSRLFQKC